jgi:hypothetical protein
MHGERTFAGCAKRIVLSRIQNDLEKQKEEISVLALLNCFEIDAWFQSSRKARQALKARNLTG